MSGGRTARLVPSLDNRSVMVKRGDRLFFPVDSPLFMRNVVVMVSYSVH